MVLSGLGGKITLSTVDQEMLETYDEYVSF